MQSPLPPIAVQILDVVLPQRLPMQLVRLDECSNRMHPFVIG